MYKHPFSFRPPYKPLARAPAPDDWWMLNPTIFSLNMSRQSSKHIDGQRCKTPEPALNLPLTIEGINISPLQKGKIIGKLYTSLWEGIHLRSRNDSLRKKHCVARLRSTSAFAYLDAPVGRQSFLQVPGSSLNSLNMGDSPSFSRESLFDISVSMTPMRV